VAPELLHVCVKEAGYDTLPHYNNSSNVNPIPEWVQSSECELPEKRREQLASGVGW